MGWVVVEWLSSYRSCICVTLVITVQITTTTTDIDRTPFIFFHGMAQSVVPFPAYGFAPLVSHNEVLNSPKLRLEVALDSLNYLENISSFEIASRSKSR